jgi:hypothetical protein
VTRNAVTIVHEGGHALAAVLTGRRLSGIRLESDTSGVTTSRGRPTGPGMVLTAFCGYPAPALVGLGAAWLLADGRAAGLLYASLVLLALVLVQVRNLWGLLTVGATGLLLAAVARHAPPPVQAGFAYLLCWFLLLAGFRPVVELQRKRAAGEAPESDADQLARLTGLPGIAWVGLFGLVSAAVLLVGGAWLLGVPLPWP